MKTAQVLPALELLMEAEHYWDLENPVENMHWNLFTTKHM